MFSGVLLVLIITTYTDVHTNDVVILQSNSIANNKNPLPQFNETLPGCVSFSKSSEMVNVNNWI